MGDFEPQAAQSTRNSLEDVLSKVANGIRPTSASTLGALIAGGGIGSQVTALGASGTVSLDPTQGQTFSITPTANVTLNAASLIQGQEISLIVATSGTTSYSISFATNFRTTGALSTGTTTAKNYVLEFVSDGTNYYEQSRTVAF